MDLSKIATLGVAIDAKAAKSGAKQVNGAFDSMAWGARSAIKGINKELTGMGRGFREVKTSTNLLSRSLKAAFSAYLIRDVIKTAVSFETFRNTLTAATGSVEGGRREMDFVIKTTRDLGLNLDSTTRSYAILTAATKGTALAGEETRKSFNAVAEASAVLGLSADQTHGIVFALSQMISKGKIAAEELRRQMGDRMPGAFRIAADAMKMSTKELDKAISTGKVFPEEFVPAFIKGIEKAYGPHTWRVVDSARAKLNRFSTDMSLLKLQFTESGFMDAFLTTLDGLSKALRDPQVIKSARSLGESLAYVVSDTDALKIALHGLTYTIESVAMGFLTVKSAADLAVSAWGKFKYKDTKDALELDISSMEDRLKSLNREASTFQGSDIALRSVQEAKKEWELELSQVEKLLSEKKTELDNLINNKPEDFSAAWKREIEELMDFRHGIWRSDPPVDLSPTKILPPLIENTPSIYGNDGDGGGEDGGAGKISASDKVISALKLEYALLTSNIESLRLRAELKKADVELDSEKGKEIQKLVDLVEKEEAVQETHNELMAEGAKITASLKTDAEKYADELQRLNDIRDEGGFSSDEIYGRAVAALKDKYSEDDDFWGDYLRNMQDNLTDLDDIAASTLSNMSSHFGKFFEDAIFDSNNLGEAFTTMATGMARSMVGAIGEMIAQWLVYKIVKLTVDKTTQAGASSAMAVNAEAASLQAGINAYSSAAAIPMTGWMMAPGAMSAAIAATSPLVASITALSTSAVGMAHEGLDSIPKTGSWILEKGERVTTEKTSAHLDRTLSRIDSGVGGRNGGGNRPENGETNALLRNLVTAVQQQKGVRVINVPDASFVEDWASSSSGERVYMNHIGNNISQIKQMLGG